MKFWPDSDYFRDNIFMRNDTIFGTCQAIGEDLGFNPNYLRVALASGIIVAPFLMVGIYLGLGLAVLAIRTLLADKVQPVARVAEAEALVAGNDEAELPRAA